MEDILLDSFRTASVLTTNAELTVVQEQVTIGPILQLLMTLVLK